MRIRYEKPQPTNPHRLTVDQHVFPCRSIKRFGNVLGRVSVHDIRRGHTRKAKPEDEIFVAKRAWDQRAESGYMKRIENSFQQLASDILAGNVCHVGEADKETINRFYALWWTRARHRGLREQEIQMNAVTGGGLTRDQEEMLEKNGVMFAREGGKFPAGQLNGLKIQMMIDHYFEPLASAQWGIIEAHEGEFIVPDIPLHTILPLTPTICLVSPAPLHILCMRLLWR